MFKIHIAQAIEIDLKTR